MDHEETLKGLGGGGGNPYNTPSLTKCTCVVSELELDVYVLHLHCLLHAPKPDGIPGFDHAFFKSYLNPYNLVIGIYNLKKSTLT